MYLGGAAGSHDLARVAAGDSGLLEGLALVRQLYSLTRPRVLVVKSACLRQLAGQLQSSQRMFDLEPIQGGYQGRRP